MAKTTTETPAVRRYRVVLLLTEKMLGTVAGGTLYSDYIASKALGDVDDELATAPAVANGATGFHTLPDGTRILYNYVLKGFFKDACSMLRRVPGTKSSGLTAFKKLIDGLVFIAPRQIRLELPPDPDLTPLERPLRAQTAQGERVALAKSDTVPVGTRLEFTLEVWGDELSQGVLREWLAYGKHRGLGQWRNGGYGTFAFELTPLLGEGE